jgi:hypothetical protein
MKLNEAEILKIKNTIYHINITKMSKFKHGNPFVA